ncbi:MAG: ATP-dependent DNA helicase RecG [Rickettsiales bacterium]|jgi:ATP-dependent DNA helicase RecG|nr:ATP-dependent DNA helicase RecG [Rickettsiales bacterium]
MRSSRLNFLFSDVSGLPGIGSRKSQVYKKLLAKKNGISGEDGGRMLDLLFHRPEKILERKIVKNTKEIDNSDIIIAEVEVLAYNPPRTGKQPYTVTCYLGNNFVSIVFYKYFENYIGSKLKIGSKVFVSGRVELYNSQVQIVHPDYIGENMDQIPVLEPIYPLTSGLLNREVIKNVAHVIDNTPDLTEWLDADLLRSRGWLSWRDSLCNLHRPGKLFDVKNCPYIERLAFDELLAQQIAISVVKNNSVRESTKAIPINSDRRLKNKFLNEVLQFKLTEDQIRAIDEIENDTFSSRRMLRLLQGDVGSGKTVVAFTAMLNYVENSGQCVIMAPTTILAAQHFDNMGILCQRLGIEIELLTSSTSSSKRKKILERLKGGNIGILVGTHALIGEDIEFKNLSFSVIDEQHRFGVKQRLMLIGKGKSMDILTMTATPIPRTLALTLYSDMDLSVIGTKPIDRKKVITVLISNKKYSELISRMKNRIDMNEKIYWVCPMVEENEQSYLVDVKTKYREFCDIFGEENVAFIHGKMSEKEKDSAMESFCSDNSKKILVSTTVIEVGVDVRDATVIIIEHPERFGLSQLHQLRGRVGRGDKQSYCLLLYYGERCSQHALKRLNIIRNIDDGFAIAEQDLKMRGIGEVMGNRQSGSHSYFFADFYRDFSLLEKAVRYAEDITANNRVEMYSDLLHLFGYANYLNGGEILN